MFRVLGDSSKSGIRRMWKPVACCFLALVVGTTSPIAQGIGFTQGKSVATSNMQSLDLGASLYLEQMIGEKLAIDATSNRLISRAEFAEVVVRLYLKLNNKTTDAIVSRSLATDSKDIFVNEACNLKFMGLDSKGRFNPNTTVTREQAATVLDKVLKVVPPRLENRYKSNLKVGMKDLKLIGIAIQPAVKNVSSNGLLPLIAGEFKPKLNLTVSETLKMTNRVLGLMDREGALRGQTMEFTYPTIKAGKFMVPDPEKSDVMAYLPRNKSADLSIQFAGTVSANRMLTPKTIHLQIVSLILSNSKFTRADAMTLLSVMDAGWDGSSRQYHFESESYIKSGVVLKEQPVRPYVHIKQGTLLSIDVHETR